MKVLLVNGSPKPEGNTYLALKEAADILEQEGIEAEIFQLGTTRISGCVACDSCRKTGQCAFNPIVNEFREKAKTADGFIFGSPVHYASISGNMKSFMDTLFYSDHHGGTFYLKPAACVAVARRAGAVTAFDEMNKYFTINNMPIVAANYWNNVFGGSPGEAAQDDEGMVTMRNLARNMAWMLKCIEAGRKTGVPWPEKETGIHTNFIR